MNLTRPRRKALQLAEHGQLKRPTTHNQLIVVDALWEAGLITWRYRNTFPGRAFLTDEGRALLHPTRVRSERPVFLRAGPLPASQVVPSDDLDEPRPEQDYTTDPAHGVVAAGEILDPLVLAGYARTASVSHARRKLAEAEQLGVDRECLSIEDRMRAARVDANMARIDLRDEFRLALKAREAGDEVGTVRHLQRIERRVHRRAA